MVNVSKAIIGFLRMPRYFLFPNSPSIMIWPLHCKHIYIYIYGPQTNSSTKEVSD